LDIASHVSEIASTVLILAIFATLIVGLYPLLRTQKFHEHWVTVFRALDPILADRAKEILKNEGIPFEVKPDGSPEWFKVGLFPNHVRIKPPLLIRVSPENKKKAGVYLQELGTLDENGKLIRPMIESPSEKTF
jgi:hypothetical protein